MQIKMDEPSIILLNMGSDTFEGQNVDEFLAKGVLIPDVADMCLGCGWELVAITLQKIPE